MTAAAHGARARGNWATAEEYFQTCLDDMQQHLPSRVGLCCCKWNVESAEWELRSHELGLWPGDLLTIPDEIHASRFRAAVEESHQAAKACTPSKKWTSQLASSTKWVVASLLDVRVPVVVHNGLADLLQMCDKVLGRNPTSTVEFGAQLSELFPIIFDTAVMQDDADSPSRHRCDGQAAFDDLYDHLFKFSKQEESKSQIKIKEVGLYTHRSSSTKNGLVFGRGIGAAARDAMCIAEAFLVSMDMKLCGRSDVENHGGRKRRWTEATSDDEDAPGTPRRTPKRRSIVQDTMTVSPCKEKQETFFESKPAQDAAAASPCKEPKEQSHFESTPRQGQLPHPTMLVPISLSGHATCRSFHNRVACGGFPSLKLQPPSHRRLTDSGIDLHGLLRKLGADLDSNGRPIVTRAMIKKVRRALAEMRRTSSEVVDAKLA